jgi:hypothetical protein
VWQLAYCIPIRAFARAFAFPLSCAVTPNPAFFSSAIHSLQQPQVGPFQTSTSGAADADGKPNAAASGASAIVVRNRRRCIMMFAPLESERLACCEEL